MEQKTFFNIGLICVFLKFLLIPPITSLTLLPRCSDYRDLRRTPNQGIIKGPLKSITQYVVVPLGRNDISSSCKSEIITRTIPLTENTKLKVLFSQSPQGKENNFVLERRPNTSEHFTVNGNFYDSFHYFQRWEYCVKALSDSELVLSFCKPDCESISTYGRFCIPKCCGPNEVMGYWGTKCRELQPAESMWKPTLCENNNCRQFDTFQKVHFYNGRKSCKGTLQRWPVSNVVMGTVNEEKKNIRIDVTHGSPVLQILSNDGEWQPNPNVVSYCVDGFVTFPTQKYDGNPEQQVFLACVVNSTTKSKSNSTTAPLKDDFLAGYESWLFTSVFIVGSLFLSTIVFVYLMLLPQHNINGLLILSYSVSLLLCYVFYAAANFLSMSHDPQEQERSLSCMITAKSSQYFLIVSDLWLTAMNLNLWLTIRSTHVVENSSVRKKVLTNYSIIAWGLPIILVAGFVLNERLREIHSQHIISDCTTAWSRSPVIDIPLKIVFLVNVIFMILTVKTILEARRTEASMRRLGSDRFTIVFFLKLFCMMGAVRFVQMVIWYFDFDGILPWYITWIQIILLLQPVPLFIMFCCNERTRELLRTKCPKLVAVLDTFAVITSTSFACSICCRKKTGSHAESSIRPGYF